jgi:hypothetical protein
MMSANSLTHTTICRYPDPGRAASRLGASLLAIGHGAAIIGCQGVVRNLPYGGGLRWQFELTKPGELERIIAICDAQHLTYDVVAEEAGIAFSNASTRSVSQPASHKDARVVGSTLWPLSPERLLVTHDVDEPDLGQRSLWVSTVSSCPRSLLQQRRIHVNSVP